MKIDYHHYSIFFQINFDINIVFLRNSTKFPIFFILVNKKIQWSILFIYLSNHSSVSKIESFFIYPILWIKMMDVWSHLTKKVSLSLNNWALFSLQFFILNFFLTHPPERKNSVMDANIRRQTTTAPNITKDEGSAHCYYYTTNTNYKYNVMNL